MSRNQQFLSLSLVLFVGIWLLSAFLSSPVVLQNLSPELEHHFQNPPLLLDLKMLSLDASLDYLPSGTLSAILPILPTTLGDMKDLLDPFLNFNSRFSPLREVIIVCPQSAVAEVRRELQAMFSSEGVDLHVSLRPWPWQQTHADVQTAVLGFAAEVTTEWVLIMDENGLKRTTKLERSALLRPPNVTMPLGPHGLALNDYVPLTSQWGLLQPAHYLCPPFVMPSFIAHAPNLNNKNGNIWTNLGSYVSEHRADAVGGLRLRTSGSSSVQLDQPVSIDSSLDWHIPLHEGILNDTVIAPSIGDLSRTTDFVFLLQELDDLQRVSSLICRLLTGESRPNLWVLIYENPYPSPNALGWKSAVFKSDACPIDYDILTGKQPFSSASSTALMNWLRGRSRLAQIVFTHKEMDPLVSFLIFQHDSIFSEATIISMPRKDLEYTDWMSSLTITELKAWHKPSVDLSIITKDRPSSLLRLLNSLSEARYFGDTLDLRINVEQDCDEKTLQIAQDYRWPQGSLFIHHRVVHGGLLPAVVESWYPKNNNSYGVLLEDDVELAPLFYAWIKMCLLRYRYGEETTKSPYLFGISLYQQKHLELPPEGRQTFNPRTLFSGAGIPNPHTPYLSQVPCSWGAVYFPEHWREFHDYLAFRLTESAISLTDDVVANVRSNHWSKSWKRFFIELAYLRGYVMLYPNFNGFASLSTNHLEVGSHVKVRSQEKQNLFLLPLMQLPRVGNPSGLLDLPDRRLPSFVELPVLNLTGFITSLPDLSSQGSRRRLELFRCNYQTLVYDILSLMCIEKPL